MPVHGVENLGQRAARPGLQVLHCAERALVSVLARTGDAVLYHSAEVVRLMSVDERVVDTDVGQSAARQQGEAVDVLAPVELPSEVDEVGTMERLDVPRNAIWPQPAGARQDRVAPTYRCLRRRAISRNATTE